MFKEDSIEKVTFKLKTERWKAVSHVERDGWTIQAVREAYAKVGGMWSWKWEKLSESHQDRERTAQEKVGKEGTTDIIVLEL